MIAFANNLDGQTMCFIIDKKLVSSHNMAFVGAIPQAGHKVLLFGKFYEVADVVFTYGNQKQILIYLFEIPIPNHRIYETNGQQNQLTQTPLTK
jgi:hypothetical protein